MKKVEVFSSNTCKNCVDLKNYLKANNIEYTEYNISKDQEARKNLIQLGYMSVPVTLIDGEHVLGFDRIRIDQLLNKNN
ncbi:MAG: glutaredoxin family protein [Paeniclostridium sordellii]|uniref:Glutaredoxin family protein n=1 Tax=Paeniclostridium hominis TaxID=2764329 RepID=A0ABR7K7G2_9FIRM|nr:MULTISPECIES: glutaredoxin family protein [Paeniclostridium]MBC6005023.1 glutaredoxin family protein [Paeniclostridium hominis]MDU1540816.1 glutaredoxin family protein [Paeniclostridium sordellii]MDU2592470.1 glutaredoxin family protein [Paeniclostridium sordellii]